MRLGANVGMPGPVRVAQDTDSADMYRVQRRAKRQARRRMSASNGPSIPHEHLSPTHAMFESIGRPPKIIH